MLSSEAVTHLVTVGTVTVAPLFAIVLATATGNANMHRIVNYVVAGLSIAALLFVVGVPQSLYGLGEDLVFGAYHHTVVMNGESPPVTHPQPSARANAAPAPRTMTEERKPRFKSGTRHSTPSDENNGKRRAI